MKPEDYLKLPYTVNIVEDFETMTFTATVEEFPGCFAQGDTPAEAYDKVIQTAETWIELCLERGQKIPKPNRFRKRNNNG